MLKYRLLQIQDTLTVAPQGDIVLFSYPDLERDIRTRVRRGLEIVFDLRELSFIDSSGIGFLLRMKNLAESAEGRSQVLNPAWRVAGIFRKLKLNDVLPVRMSQPAWRGISSPKSNSGSLRLAVQASPC